jgi:hypothetical protein
VEFDDQKSSLGMDIHRCLFVGPNIKQVRCSVAPNNCSRCMWGWMTEKDVVSRVGCLGEVYMGPDHR